MNGDMSEVLAALNQVSDPFIATKCSALIKVKKRFQISKGENYIQI